MRERGDDSYEGSLLEPGRDRWRVATADRFTPLMENNAYFDALSSSLHKAKKSIVVLGWQFDPRTRLDPESPLTDRRGNRAGKRARARSRVSRGRSSQPIHGSASERCKAGHNTRERTSGTCAGGCVASGLHCAEVSGFTSLETSPEGAVRLRSASSSLR